MDNLEHQLSNLPKSKLSKTADFKIKFKIYRSLYLAKTRGFVQKLFHPHSLLAKVSYASLAVLVFLGSTAVYAVNNDHITPGNTLYPLKKTIESIEQQLAVTKPAQVDTLNKLSERRLKEAINLAQEDSDLSDQAKQAEASVNIQQSLDEALDNLDEAMTTTQKINDNKSAQKVKENMKKQNEDMIKYLDDLEDIAEQKNDQIISDKVEQARQTIDKYQKILETEYRSKDKKHEREEKLERKNNSRKFKQKVEDKSIAPINQRLSNQEHDDNQDPDPESKQETED